MLLPVTVLARWRFGEALAWVTGNARQVLVPSDQGPPVPEHGPDHRVMAYGAVPFHVMTGTAGVVVALGLARGLAYVAMAPGAAFILVTIAAL